MSKISWFILGVICGCNVGLLMFGLLDMAKKEGKHD